MRRQRIHVLDTDTREEAMGLDLWPGDIVWTRDFKVFGRVNEHGQLIEKLDLNVQGLGV